MSNPQLNVPTQTRSRPGTSHFVPRADRQLATDQTMESETPFCRTCTANQALQMSLLANYLPSDSDQDEPSGSESRLEKKRLLDDLEQYKESLETRYPMMCADCSPKVSAVIRDRDYRSKAALLHSSARRLAPISSLHSATPTKLKPPILSPFNSMSFQRPVMKGMGSKLWIFQEWIWRLRGAMWIFSHFLGILGLNAAAYILRIYSLLLRRQQIPSYSDNSWILAPSLAAQWRAMAFGAISTTLVILFIGSLYSLRIDSQIRLITPRKSFFRRSSLHSLPSATRPVTDEDLFSTLSLMPVSSRAVSKLTPSHLDESADSNRSPAAEMPVFGRSTALSNPFIGPYHPEARRTPKPGKEISSMEWEPTPDANLQRVSSDHSFVLCPQTFLPPIGRRGETGIEHMFEKSVKLDQDLQRASEGVWSWVPNFLSRSSNK
ncbi:hypothetical protein CROQUDRAFT_49026 [Cronartium quercuum f. sp. fusiforme G11]|uniref:Ima1 N-terminal domain-containing protein n=1 Tax=Cronartium quercuum f. sp. fusiforme G11 TaxID=708437 RepID=A0A9P6NB15_9BASI|nr:hypothetical protein CROQUDRAFT_49026 [Cronartium quercuum f. sp. fusiforme G11]